MYSKNSVRSSTCGVVPDNIHTLNHNIVLDVFHRICLSRYFELGLIEAIKNGFVTYQVYLSMGQESIAAALSLSMSDYLIFPQHRCHAVYLAFGGDPIKLRDELLGLPSGTSGGRAGSNCIQNHENGIEMFGHHGLIGENVPLGVGAALGSGRPTVCFFGDGAAEEDYVLSAMGFAATHKLPVFFVCEDNNLSILTPVATRRSWSMANVARSFGMSAYELSDDPWTLLTRAGELKNNLPAFLNCFTCRKNWHVGVGVDGPPEWDRFDLVKEDLKKIGVIEEANETEVTVRKSMEELWDTKQLRILLER